MQEDKREELRNVYGEALQMCCSDPLTGFYRNGHCQTGTADLGTHIICAQVTTEFLEYSLCLGNDLITPNQNHNFPGLKDGDCWCLCVSRWLEAYQEGVAPPVNLKATHIKALEYVPIEILESHALRLI